MSIRKNNRDLSTYVIGWEKYADNVNWNGGAAAEKASTCESRGIARPGGAIPGGRVGGGANASTSAGIATPGGAIPGAEVGGGANALRCAAWCHRRSRCGAWVSPSPSLRRVCCGRCRRAAHGVAGAVVGRSVRRVGVTAAVFAARVVLRSRSVQRVWC